MSSVQIIHSRAFHIKKNAKNKSKFLNYNIKDIAERGILPVNMVIHICISLGLQGKTCYKFSWWGGNENVIERSSADLVSLNHAPITQKFALISKMD